ncbi:MAG: type II toxin-antitoxin system VapC family toxin [Verrucomicrobia bacterium]|nr:type II toxin-antitoxin system VapC family toxin [Verrucomicrobiota bacterium]
MICPDVNLLLYAIIDSFPQHEKAKQWWDGVLSSDQFVGIGHVVILGFIRVATNSRVFPLPLTIQQAVQVVDSWLAQANVEMIAPADNHWENLRTMLTSGNAGGNLTTDAHIAALASDYGLVIYSNDADFVRFPNVKCVNPV